MLSSEERRGGFSLVEAIVVVCVIAVLAGILIPIVSSARQSGRLGACVANLAHISVASKMYFDDHGGPPLTDLPVALADYVDTPKVFVCPDDTPGSKDSYSEFYVARPRARGDEFLVGCPRHRSDTRVAVAFGKSDTEADRVAAATWNGQPIGPGDTVTGGQIKFSDGSTVNVPDGMTVGMLMSFGTHGTLYSMVWVPEGSQGTLDCNVTPGAMFEVVTPAAIAGVQGTKFTVSVSESQDSYDQPGAAMTQVAVREGTVWLQDRVDADRQTVKTGKTATVTKSKKHTPKGPKTGKDGHHHGHDD